MKLKSTEKQVQQAVMEYLGTLENIGKVAWWTRLNSGFMFGNRKNGSHFAVRLGREGDPDIIGCRKDGIFFAIECKATDGRLSPKQFSTMERITNSGALYSIARSVDDVEGMFV